MEQITHVQNDAIAAIQAARTTEELRAIELDFLGKNGKLSALMKGIGALSNDQKPQFGAKINEAKNSVQSMLDSRVQDLKAGELSKQFEAERIDGWDERLDRV